MLCLSRSSLQSISLKCFFHFDALKSQLTPFSSRQLSPQQIPHHSTTPISGFTYKAAKKSEIGESKIEQEQAKLLRESKKSRKQEKLKYEAMTTSSDGFNRQTQTIIKEASKKQANK